MVAKPSILAALIVLGLVPAPAGRASTPIPPERRIAAEVVRTVAPPAADAMHMPTDVAVDSRGNLYVADGARDRVLRFDARGTLAQTLAAFGNERLSRPVGLTVDAKDNLWIADTGSRAVRVVSPDGKLLITAPVPPLNDKAPADPTDVAVTPDGLRAYVVDNSNHRILVRDNRTGQWTAMGQYGRALGQFQWPFMACIGAENYVLVSEAIGCRVQQISPRDRWAGEVGRWGVELGQFYRPKGVAADDARGRIYVSDSTLNVVQVFGPGGRLEGVLTNRDGDQPLRFDHPMGMCFDKTGLLYVVELNANRVAVVKFINAAPLPSSPSPRGRGSG